MKSRHNDGERMWGEGKEVGGDQDFIILQRVSGYITSPKSIVGEMTSNWWHYICKFNKVDISQAVTQKLKW